MNNLCDVILIALKSSFLTIKNRNCVDECRTRADYYVNRNPVIVWAV